jgi:cathepsin C
MLSPASVISCSRTNQGCAGGYPYLVGKYGKEVGFVEDSCQPYAEQDDKCFNYCFHQKTWQVKDYGYVGGYYGGCDEQTMMHEIYENGPIIVAINATPELYYYSTGIFHSDAKKTDGKADKNVNPWEYTNHAVVCIGWGEEIVKDEPVKYWILKNSWGDTWGERGYFRMERGTNMASVEAQAVYLSPNLD